jgi:phosphohistidine swiveling domain-containing protein
VLCDARAALAEVWDLHYSITMQLVPLRAMQRKMGRRLCEDWDGLEPWVNVPDELVWGSLYDTIPLELPLGPGEFLANGFYEVADDREPWSRFRTGHSAAPAGEPGDNGDRSRPRDVAWQIERSARAFGLQHLTRYVGQAMAWREMSKSLSMRCLHLFRRMLPRLAEAVGQADEDWPYLTIDELADAHLHPELGEVAAERRAACEEALASEMPELLDFSRPAPLTQAPQHERAGRGVSAGCVTGVVVSSGAAGETRNGDPRILVCDSVDADVEPALPHIDGVVTARGSALSHVAILMREHGIPAVVGHTGARSLQPGQVISINGTTGEVRILD